ncbi:hypothetical protein Tco_0411212 [Tanacetum coccineum]
MTRVWELNGYKGVTENEKGANGCTNCYNEHIAQPLANHLTRHAETQAQGPRENRPNQVAANNGGQGRGNQGNHARGRAFMLGAEEARQDPNIMTGVLLVFLVRETSKPMVFERIAKVGLLCCDVGFSGMVMFCLLVQKLRERDDE